MAGTENTFDTNNNRTLVAVSNADGSTPVNLWAVPGTHALKTDGSAVTQPISIAGNVTTILANNGSTSTGNSTIANLGTSAVFTGTGEDILNYSAVQISVFSSHASASDGLSLQQSSDNTNWDFIDMYTIAAATGKVFSVQSTARYFRIVYTNGATPTTSLRIQTVYHVIAPNPSSQRSADAYTNETDLTQQWAFNSLYNGTTWDRMRGDVTNGLDVDVTRLPSLVAGAATIGSVGVNGAGATSIAKLEDVAHASGDMGVPAWGVRNDNLATTYGADQDYTPLATGLKGQLFNTPTPLSGSNLAPSNNATTAYATNLVVKGGAGTLYSITGYNSKALAQFIQIHNTTTLPGDTAVPIMILTVGATSNFSIDLGVYGKYFSTGITVCNSSTGPTKTVGSADCWFEARFL